MALLAMISTAFENAISESLHFQPLEAPENGGTSMCRGDAKIPASLQCMNSPPLTGMFAPVT
jgi:hypothetical protein